jgi:hypothetical protein
LRCTSRFASSDSLLSPRLLASPLALTYRHEHLLGDDGWVGGPGAASFRPLSVPSRPVPSHPFRPSSSVVSVPFRLRSLTFTRADGNRLHPGRCPQPRPGVLSHSFHKPSISTTMTSMFCSRMKTLRMRSVGHARSHGHSCSSVRRRPAVPPSRRPAVPPSLACVGRFPCSAGRCDSL